MKKRLLATLLCIAMLSSLMAVGAAADTTLEKANNDIVFIRHIDRATSVPDGYTGIYTVSDFNAIRNNLSGNYILMNDINLADLQIVGGEHGSSSYWEPIQGSFSGVLDGNGYSISNLNISASSSGEDLYVGLFSQIGRGGVVKNLMIIDSNIKAQSYERDYLYCGFITAVCFGEVNNCSVKQSSLEISADFRLYVGAIAGYLREFAEVNNCINQADIIADTNSSAGSYYTLIGGIVGGSLSGIINTSTNYGSITLNPAKYGTVGGIVGGNGTVKVSECFNNGKITIQAIQSATADEGAVSADIIVGGIAGDASMCTNCYNSGDISSNVNVQHAGDKSAIAHNTVGGICGSIGVSNIGSISNCYNIGNLSFSTHTSSIYPIDLRERVGSIAGVVANIAENCYYINNYGDAIAYTYEDAIVTNCNSLTYEQMKEPSNFDGFDFDLVWTMGDNDYPYPLLRAFQSGDVSDEPLPEEPSTTKLELLSTYPSNGESIKNSANGLALVFNHALNINPNWLNGSIYIKDYETDEIVKEFDDVKYASNGGHISGSTMTIRYGLVGLDVGKTYYVEIDPDVILAEELLDGKWNYFDGLEKGEWTFSVSEESTFKFLASEGNQDLEYTYNYTDDYFNVNSYYYNHDLANTSLALSLSAFNSCIAPNAKYDKTDAARNVIAMLGDMGFEDINVDSYEGKPTATSIAQAIGHKSIIIGGMRYTLLTIAVRGGGYESEWFNNFKVGSDNQHVGFNDSANSVIESIEEYIEDELTETERSNLKIWLTGFGRGAAVANVAGHKINTLAGDSDSVFANVDTGNVYVYTFATPMAAASEQASPKEENIYNIINPVDLIPKLTPSVWGFYRYGITYSLPSQETDSKLFEAIKYDATNISGELTGEITTIALTWQGSALDSIVNAMSIMEPDSIPSKALQYALGKYFEDKYSSAPGEIGVFGTVKEIWNLVSTVVDVATLDFTSLAKTYLLKPAVVEGGSETLDQALSYIEMAHYPETYLAWMYALDAEEFGHGIYRKDYINCPVDVAVYDEDGKNVAGFKDEEPYFEADGYVTAYVDENGQKVLVFPNDREYRVEITPYDEGTLSYTVEEYSAADNETRRVVSYQSIPIVVGDKFEGVVGEISNPESETIYTFSKNEDGELEPTVDQSGNEVENLTVNVSVTGNGQANGGGTFLNGEYALLTATPNSGASFIGWYIDGTLLSTETEVRILVDDDKYVTAVFTSGGNIPAVDVPNNQPEEPEGPTDSLPFTDVSVGDWFYDYVAYVYTNGLMDGVSEMQFDPNGTMTRAMVWAILARIDGETVTGANWAAAARTWAMTSGVSDGTDENGLVTREQFATMLWRYAGEPASTYSLEAYTDASGVNEWAQTAMQWAVENGIITGVTSTTLEPQGTATRAQAAAMLMRYVENIK